MKIPDEVAQARGTSIPCACEFQIKHDLMYCLPHWLALSVRHDIASGEERCIAFTQAGNSFEAAQGVCRYTTCSWHITQRQISTSAANYWLAFR